MTTSGSTGAERRVKAILWLAPRTVEARVPSQVEEGEFGIEIRQLTGCHIPRPKDSGDRKRNAPGARDVKARQQPVVAFQQNRSVFPKKSPVKGAHAGGEHLGVIQVVYPRRSEATPAAQGENDMTKGSIVLKHPLLLRMSVVPHSNHDTLAIIPYDAVGINLCTLHRSRQPRAGYWEDDSRMGLEGLKTQLSEHVVDFRQAGQVGYGEVGTAQDGHDEAKCRRPESWLDDPTREIADRNHRGADRLEAVQCGDEAHQVAVRRLEGEAYMVFGIGPAPVEQAEPSIGRDAGIQRIEERLVNASEICGSDLHDACLHRGPRWREQVEG